MSLHSLPGQSIDFPAWYGEVPSSRTRAAVEQKRELR